MAYVQTIFDCKNAREFIDFLRISHERWVPNGNYECRWIFRGESSTTSGWKLQPSAWRDNVRTSQRFKICLNRDIVEAYVRNNYHFNEIYNREIDRDRFIAIVEQTQFEAKIVRAFVNVADDIGFTIPGPPYPDRDSLDPFRNDNQFGEHFHAAVALTQHHGFPTRLLDWTKNPLIAAAFAASSEIHNGMEDRMVVIAVDRDLLSDSYYKELAIPRSQIGYLHAQEALFTYRWRANEYFRTNGKWPDMDYEINPSAIRRVTLPRSEAVELRRLLWAERVSLAHLMPVFDNVAKALDMVWGDAILQKVRA